MEYFLVPTPPLKPFNAIGRTSRFNVRPKSSASARTHWKTHARQFRETHTNRFQRKQIKDAAAECPLLIALQLQDSQGRYKSKKDITIMFAQSSQDVLNMAQTIRWHR